MAAPSQQPRLLQSSAPRHAAAESALPHDEAQYNLLSASWELQAERVGQVLSDTNTDFLVVGVLGTQGSGKSMLTNALCGLALPPPGNEAATTSGQPAARLETAQQLAAGQHCTCGVDLRVHPHSRMIVLDTQPLPCASQLAALLRADRPQLALGPAMSGAVLKTARALGASSTPVEAVLAAMALQLTGMLFSVCHVVVVMVEDLRQPELLQLLEAADMLARGVPDVSTPPHAWPDRAGLGGPRTGEQSGSAGKQPEAGHVADAVLVWSAGEGEVSQQQLAQDARWLAERLQHTCWAARGVQLRVAASEAGPLAPTYSLNVTALEGIRRPQQQQQQQQGLWPPASLQHLVAQLAAWQPRPCLRTLSESEWLQGVQRVWAAVQSSGEMVAFVSMLLRSRFAGAGGWRLR